MQTPKEIFMELLKPDGRPERQLVQYEALYLDLRDPINGYLRGNRKRGTTSVDRWGTTILFPEDAPGATPHITPELKVLKDITHWCDYVHAPDLAANCAEGWEEHAKQAREACGPDRVLCGFMGTGIFEQCHFLMGFEDTLTNLKEHPKEMHELIDYITDYRIRYVSLLIDGLKPEAVFSHDDWGTKTNLFMQPEVWREFFKEPYRRFYGYIRSRGCIAIHHADSYLAPITDDMAEIGIQVWQGVLPENDIPALQEKMRGRLVLMGGIGAAIDRKDAEEAEIRAYVAEQLEADCPGGHFIPSITYGIAGTVYPHVDPFIDDEIRKYNAVLHMPGTKRPAAVRRVKAAAAVTDKKEEKAETAANGTLNKIAQALYRGQKDRVLKLCGTAVEEGCDAKTILSDGLMAGMGRVGEDFTLNKVFVPEMLMAAKAMSAATEYLKPLLTGGVSGGAGRVCIGTVKGDMHDIGKNLVKIMMEGSGLEVIDLGNDVPAETFVQTAAERDCDIICCSALLTTCMGEMRNVVSLAKEKNIRDRVKIMVGGAPVSQSFCDEIGADAYTPDAGEAARVAVKLIKAC